MQVEWPPTIENQRWRVMTTGSETLLGSDDGNAGRFRRCGIGFTRWIRNTRENHV